MHTLSLTLALALAQLDDAPPADFDAYQERYQFDCNGPIATLPKPTVREHGGYKYEFLGATVKARRAQSPKPVSVAVIAGIKDAEPETKELLDEFFARFHERDVEVVLVGGDTADSPEGLDGVYDYLTAKTKLPILTVAGNSERAGAHNYAVMKQRKKGHTHLINMDLVRRYDGPGFDVVSLGGYYDPKFLHMAGGCLYTQADVDAVVKLAQEADDPVLLLSHGPPKQSGKDALDFVPEVGNVGDAALTRAIQAAKIPFGAFGHILEAGGRATDLAGKPLAAGKWHKSLYLNQGSANPLPWKLNGGGTSYGLAMILTFDGKQAKYEVLKGKKKAAAAIE